VKAAGDSAPATVVGNEEEDVVHGYLAGKEKEGLGKQ
jgi:hypothetical protein